MVFNGVYNIDLLLNGNELDLSPQEMYFSIHDSIHRFFSTATLELNDPTGQTREYLVTSEGNYYTLTYGIENKLLINDFVVISDELPEVTKSGILGGKSHLNLIHRFYDHQEVANYPHTGRISNIVNFLVKNYEFREIKKNDTSSDSTWYQLAMNEKDFIEKVLLPNAYSENMDYSTYFAFIDCENIFQFRNYSSMASANPVATLNYNPVSLYNYSIDSIMDIKPFKSSSEQTKKNRRRRLISRNVNTGEYIQSDDRITDHPKSKATSSKVPIIDNNELYTDYTYLSFNYENNPGEEEAFKARLCREQYSGFFLEKYLVTLPFNPILKSGVTVQMNLSIMNDSNEPVYGEYISGVYLVEDCIHSWTGGDIKRGMTELIVSRKFVIVPKTHILGINYLE